ncbi:hypothetical protein [Borreliella carolinensis]|uniref:hypothetical protein n=1 Tax=Borreliella carolinensis TaxID=478174 RepID=UPI003AF07E95
MKIKRMLNKLINDSKIQLNSQYKLVKLMEVIFSEYKKLLKLRYEVTSKMLKDLQNQVQGSK